MSDDSKTILEAALALPPDDRIEIAERLMFSLDEVHQREIEEAWNSEIQRRMDEVDRGEVAMIPVDEAMRRIRERKRI